MSTSSRILIVDSGATKSDWTVIREGKPEHRIRLAGINAVANPTSVEVIDEFFAQHTYHYNEIYFYTAGISTPRALQSVTHKLEQACPGSLIEVKSDILGAARALSCNESSIVTILGTGSNSVIFDGKDIIELSASPGYLLGDYGSGAHIGKLILRDYFYRHMPEQDRALIEEETDIRSGDFLSQLYASKRPNMVLARYTHFLDRCSQAFRKRILETAFTDLFDFQIRPLANKRDYKLNFVGSVAYVFKEKLTEVARSYGFDVSRIVASPMEGLIEYHLKESAA